MTDRTIFLYMLFINYLNPADFINRSNWAGIIQLN